MAWLAVWCPRLPHSAHGQPHKPISHTYPTLAAAASQLQDMYAGEREALVRAQAEGVVYLVGRSALQAAPGSSWFKVGGWWGSIEGGGGLGTGQERCAGQCPDAGLHGLTAPPPPTLCTTPPSFAPPSSAPYCTAALPGGEPVRHDGGQLPPHHGHLQPAARWPDTPGSRLRAVRRLL